MFSDIKNISKHTAIYGIGDILSKGIGFFLIPLYTHYLNTDQYGILELLNLTSYIAGLLLAMGIVQWLIRYYFEYDDQRRREQVISVALITTWAVTLAGLAGLILFSRDISSLVFKSPDYYRFFNIIFITTIINLCSEIPMAVLRIEQRSVFFVSISLTILVVTFFLNILFIVHFHMGIMGILAAGLIANGLAGVFLTLYMVSRIRLSYSKKIMKQMFSYGLPLIGSWLGMFILHFGDRFLLQRLDSLDSVGIYGLAYKFGMLANLLVTAPFFMAWGPKRFEIAHQPDAKEVFAHVFTYFCFMHFFVTLGIAVLIKDVIGIAAAETYRSAYRYVPTILLAYIFCGAYSFVQFGLLQKNKTGILGIVALSSAAANIGLNYLLIPKLQIWGAALVTLISFGLIFIVMLFISQKLYHIAFQWRRILTMAAVVGALYSLSCVINLTNVGISIAVKFLIGLSFPIGLYIIGFFTPAERDKIRQLLRGMPKGWGVHTLFQREK